MPGDLQTRIYISAKTEALAAGLQKAEQMTAQTMKRMDALQSRPGGGIGGAGAPGGLDAFSKQFQVAEKLGKVFVSLEAAAAGFKGISAAIRGDWEGVDSALRSLPFGIGTLAGMARDLKAEWSGVKAETEAAVKAAQEMQRGNQARGKAISALEGGTAAFQSSAAQSARALALGAVGDDDVARVKLQNKHAIEDIEANLEKQLKELSDSGADKKVKEVFGEELRKQAGLAIEAKRAEAAQVEARAAEQARQKALEAEKQFQDRLADLQGKYRVQELESQGETLAAKLQAIENSYRSQIEKAEAGERELLQKIQTEEQVAAVSLDNQRKEQERQAERGKEYDLQARAEEQAKARIAQTVSAIRGQSLSAEDAGFLTRGTGTDRGTEIAAEQLKVQEESRRILDEVRRDLRKRQQFVEVGFAG